MTCDSAYYYSNENKIEAFSKIKIWQILAIKGNIVSDIFYGQMHFMIRKGTMLRIKRLQLDHIAEAWR